MNTVDQQSIDQVLKIKDAPVVSMYMPTHRYPTPPHMQEDMIRLKNSIRAAKEQLTLAKTDETVIHCITQKLEQLLNAESFWPQTTEGLALFATRDNLMYFHLPLECEEYVEVGSTANITPLLALSSYDQPYYLLALAVHNPVLYKGDMYGVERMDINFPSSPEDALNIDEMFSNSNTVRGISTRGGGNDMLSSHGQGDSREAGTEERLTYFRMIDSKITSSKDINQQLPLLIAGTDNEIAEYRANSHHSHLMEAQISGNYKGASDRELHALSWPMVQSECCSGRNELFTTSFAEHQGTGKSSSDMEEIKEAAKIGRVEALLLELITSTRDTISESIQPITKIVFPREMSAAVNSLAVATYRQGGKIVALMQQTMPAKTALAAIYRY